MSALFVGRFQPFHLGHLDALKQIFEKENHVIIVIGSAEDNFVFDNPFTAGERYQMIEAGLCNEKVNGETITKECFSIIPVWDIDNYAAWADHVENLVPPFRCVYTNSNIVRRLFLENKKHKVLPLKFNLKISATAVRQKMLSGKDWQKLVPKKVGELLKKWKAAERLKEIHEDVKKYS